MLAVLIAGVSVSAGAFVWYKIVLPFGRMLEESEELERGDWPAAEARAAKPSEAMTTSLVNLSNALEATRSVSYAREVENEQTVLPAA